MARAQAQYDAPRDDASPQSSARHLRRTEFTRELSPTACRSSKKIFRRRAAVSTNIFRDLQKRRATRAISCV
jgi:hypothetical protein